MSTAYLDHEVQRASKVKLPVKMERLYELFREMEEVSVLLFARKKPITLDDLQRTIIKNAKSGRSYLPRLTSEILAKFLYIYPTSYSVKLVSRAEKPGQPLKNTYVLVPNLRDDLYPHYREPPMSPVKPTSLTSELVVPSPPISPQKPRQMHNSDYLVRSPRKSPTKPMARTPRLDFGPKFEPWRKKCRVMIFKFKLYEYLKTEHQNFLREINVKFEQTNENLFHPDFLLKHLPDVPCAELPAPPKSAIQKTMKDYLVTVEIPTVLRSVEKVTKELRTPTKIKLEAPDSPVKEVPAATCAKPEQKPMKSRMNLLERIQAKEREAKEKEARRDLALEKRLSRLEELKIRALNVIYSEYTKRTSMEQAALYQRLKVSIGMRQDDFNGMVEILTEIAPLHFALETLTSSKACYLKMMDRDLESLTQIIDREIARCQERLKSLMP